MASARPAPGHSAACKVRLSLVTGGRRTKAAKDTAALIEESIAKSNDGKTKVDQVATAMRAITEDANKVKALVDDVNLRSQEQARGIEQIGKAITQMEQVTQKTAANAEESASAAEELTAQSEALKDIVVRLTAMVGGGERDETGRRRASRQMPTPECTREVATVPRKLGPVASLAWPRANGARKPSNGHAAAMILAGFHASKNAIPPRGGLQRVLRLGSRRLPQRTSEGAQ